MTYLGLKNKIVTKFTSLVAVDENISRNSDIPILSHQIAHNIPEGWEDPKLTKLANSFVDLFQVSDQKLISSDEISGMQYLNINFVQTDTNKNLFYAISLIFSFFAIYIFYNRQKFY